MQTSHLTHLAATFSPLTRSLAHRIPRLLLSRLPSSPMGAGGNPLKVTTTILPQSSREPARLIVGFKGGEELRFVEITKRLGKMEKRRLRQKGEKDKGETVTEKVDEGVLEKLKEGEVDLGKMAMDDVLEEVGRRCRVLTRKEQIAGGN